MIMIKEGRYTDSRYSLVDVIGCESTKQRKGISWFFYTEKETQLSAIKAPPSETSS